MARERWIERMDTWAVSVGCDAFLAEIEAVCKKHHMAITFEESAVWGGGGFLMKEFSEENMADLLAAGDGRK